eukprot:COSAG02_NODE_4807_length_4956_cov_1.868231_1_plen_54_part_10
MYIWFSLITTLYMTAFDTFLSCIRWCQAIKTFLFVLKIPATVLLQSSKAALSAW